MNIDIVPFLNVIVLEAAKAAVPVVVALGLSYLVKFLHDFRKEVGEDKWAQLEGWITIAVKAAEQTGLSSQVADYGAEKKAYALDLVKRKAAELGLKNLAVDDLSALIEKEVYQQFNEVWPQTATLETTEPANLYAAPFQTVVGYSDVGSTLGSIQASFNGQDQGGSNAKG